MATLDHTTTNMYPPPPDAVIQQLRHNVVDVVSYAQYTLHIVFSTSNRISCSAPFRFGSAQDQANLPVQDFPISESCMMRAVASTIADVDCDVDGTLTLQFSNGDILVIYANDPAREAYTLMIDGSEFVV